MRKLAVVGAMVAGLLLSVGYTIKHVRRQMIAEGGGIQHVANGTPDPCPHLWPRGMKRLRNQPQL